MQPFQLGVILALLPVFPALGDQLLNEGQPSATVEATSPSIHLRGGMADFAARATAGEALHVATLGGSITQNASGHSGKVPEWLALRFPEATFTFTNAGYGSTCSMSGAFRVHDHVLAKAKLDLLIVEFAVNDDQDASHPREVAIRGMEGIVRRALKANPDCSILMIHYVNPSMLAKISAGETPVSSGAHETVAKHYGITSVDVGVELAAGISEGRYTWKDYGGVHPKPFGYQLATNLVTSALEASFSQPAKAASQLPRPIDGQSYDAGKFVAPNTAMLGDDWTQGHPVREQIPEGGLRDSYFTWPMIRATKPGSALLFPFQGRAVGAFVLAGPDAGIVETRINGGEWKKTVLHHHYSKGLNYPRSVLFASGLPQGEHSLDLRISTEKPEGSKGTAATILYFEVNE